MKAEEPKYRIKYIDCSEKGHQGEKANIVCLEPGCRNNCLVCSLCLMDNHIGHKTRPIKFHLDEKIKHYSQNPINFSYSLEGLENQRDLLLTKLKYSVEKLAAEFMQLEKEIMDKFEELKNEAMQIEQKRKQFQDFYYSMIKDGVSDSHFLLKEYLLDDIQHKFTENDIIGTFTTKTCEQIRKISKNLQCEGQFAKLGKQIQEQSNPFELILANELFMMPVNLKKDKNVIYQSLVAFGSPSICGFKPNLVDSMGRIRIKIVQLPAGSKISIGALTEAQMKNANYVFKGDIFTTYIDSTGKVKNGVNSIGVFQVGDVIELMVKNNQLRLKSKHAKAQLNYFATNHLLFVALQGLSKIEFVTKKGKIKDQ